MLPLNTSWMWPENEDGGVNGATIDTIDHQIMWFDDAGCACGDSVAVQSFEQFEQKGPALPMPDDVLAELKATIVSLQQA